MMVLYYIYGAHRSLMYKINPISRRHARLPRDQCAQFYIMNYPPLRPISSHFLFKRQSGLRIILRHKGVIMIILGETLYFLFIPLNKISLSSGHNDSPKTTIKRIDEKNTAIVTININALKVSDSTDRGI